MARGATPRRARDLTVSDVAAPGTTGFSNDTLMFTLSYEQDGTAHRDPLVVRIKPTGFQVFPEYDLGRQFRVQQRLADTDVPVARMYWEEDGAEVLGAPFYVMERVDGRIPTDNPPYHSGGWMTEIPPAERTSIWWSGLDVLASIHRLDWRGLGFETRAMSERGPTPIAQQLDYYADYLSWAARGKPQPTCEPALAWLREHQPEDEPVGLCWGDARIGNMIFREGRCVAVLDWEMVTLGNPVQDLSWWLFLDRHHSQGIGVERLPGFPSREETVARWQEKTGLPVEHLHYYEIFAGFRFGVIMSRLAQQMVEYGVLPADSTFETDNTVTRLLADLLGLPAPGEGG